MFGRTFCTQNVLAHFIPLTSIINHFAPQNKCKFPLITVDNFDPAKTQLDKTHFLLYYGGNQKLYIMADKKIKKLFKLLRKKQQTSIRPVVVKTNQSISFRNNDEVLPEKAAMCFSENEIDLMAM